MVILVVESESRHAERASDGLGSDGWSVEIVSSCRAAVDAAAKRPPQLVLVNVELAGARELLRKFAQTHGGPGAIALVPEVVSASAEAAAREADETLSKPFQDSALRLLARRMVAGERTAKKLEEDASGKRMTSQELFGDLLAEVERAVAQAEASAPAPTAAAPAPPAITPPPAARPAFSPRKSENIDELLSRTLSGLELPGKASRPAAAAKSPAPAKPLPPAAAPAPPLAARPAPAAAPSIAPPPIAVPIPAPAPAASVALAAPVAPIAAPAPPRTPPLAPMAPVAPVAPAAPAPPPAAAAFVAPASEPARAPATKSAADLAAARRPSREIDLSQLDELARPRAREATPVSKAASTASKAADSLTTQRLPTSPSFLQSPSAEFGQYTLLERIAVGGMAEVWKARMKGVEGFQKTVAIKRILPHLTDSSDFVTMFIDEAKLAAQLNHNNIIHIYDLGKINDDYFIAMEFVDGKDLRAILNQARAESRPLPMGLALFIASRLSSALDHAHRQKDFEGRSLGLVHRDVSPQNVLISYGGDIKLCDFGIVKAVTKASKTQMGALKGKLQYMSPEQAWGRPVDERSDLFSLGSLLFEMLTGRRLFSGESEMSVLDAVREGRIQPPRDLDPRLPLEINALVLKALARDPEDRFQNASAMQREVDSILVSLKPSPTQAELGAYLDRLFEGERHGAPAAAAGASAVAVPAGAASPAASAAVPKKADISVVAPTGVSKIEDVDAGKGRKLLWLAIGGAAAAGLVAYLLLGRGKPAPTPQTPPPATESVPAPVEPGATEPAPSSVPSPSDSAPAGATPAPGTSSVDQRVSDEVKRREGELKKKYEEELAKRRSEIEKLNKPPAAAAVPAPTSPPAEAAAAAPAPAPTSAAEPPPAPVPTETEPDPAPAETVAAEPAPAAPLVKEGDLVQPGAGVKPPVLAGFTKPEYPPLARRLKVEGTVILSLLVDETGRVIDTRLESGVVQNVGINEACLSAARTARFHPATKSGVRVKMWYQLKIPFKL